MVYDLGSRELGHGYTRPTYMFTYKHPWRFKGAGLMRSDLGLWIQYSLRAVGFRVLIKVLGLRV